MHEGKHAQAEPSGLSRQKFYRPELDVLRLLAFVLVFAHHMWPRDLGYYLSRNLPYPELQTSLANACGFGLPLFFFLSAFLITSLLLREKDTGGVRIGAFYMRRILRIWPLYYLGIALGTLIMLRKHDLQFCGTPLMFTQFALLSGNWYWAIGRSDWAWENAFTPLWSISVEEQFYILWPLAMATLSRRSLWIACVVIALAAVLTEGLLGHWHSNVDAVVWSNSFVQFEMFAAGAASALFFERRTFAAGWRIRAALAATTCLCWFVASWGLQIKYFGNARSGPALIAGYALVAIGCLTGFFTLFGVTRRFNRGLVFLGQISFGLYVFHLSAAQLVDKYIPKLVEIPDTLTAHLALAVFVALPFAIAMAVCSYFLFERPFLLLKKSFTVIPSRAVT